MSFNYKEQPEYKNASEYDKQFLDNILKDVDKLSTGMRMKMAAIVALTLVIRSNSSFEIKYDIIKTVVDLMFNVGREDTFKFQMEMFKKGKGSMPQIAMMFAMAKLNNAIIIDNDRIVNMINVLEIEKDK